LAAPTRVGLPLAAATEIPLGATLAVPVSLSVPGEEVAEVPVSVTVTSTTPPLMVTAGAVRALVRDGPVGVTATLVVTAMVPPDATPLISPTTIENGPALEPDVSVP